MRQPELNEKSSRRQTLKEVTGSQKPANLIGAVGQRAHDLQGPTQSDSFGETQNLKGVKGCQYANRQKRLRNTLKLQQAHWLKAPEIKL